MSMNATPRNIIQILDGPLKGLIAQVLSVEDGKLKCLHRDFGGQSNFFDVPVGGAYSVAGVATLGPKPRDQAEAPVLPPPLNPQELLEPLPADVKAVPMLDEADIPPAVPLPPEARKKTRGPKRRIQPLFVQEAPKPPKPPVKTEPYTALVKNALGDETVVTIGVPEGKNPIQCNGWAVIRAGKIIPNVKPFAVSDWTKVEKP